MWEVVYHLKECVYYLDLLVRGEVYFYALLDVVVRRESLHWSDRQE